MSRLRRVRRPQLALIALLVALAIGYAVNAVRDEGPRPVPSSSSSMGSLPPEVAQTITLIKEGGPYPYSKDGSVFRNAEGLLPDRPDGYYREYTVRTPGEDDRGARRLVVGRDGDVWYTADHYASFIKLDVRL